MKFYFYGIMIFFCFIPSLAGNYLEKVIRIIGGDRFLSIL